jgi:hypothetical protein
MADVGHSLFRALPGRTVIYRVAESLKGSATSRWRGIAPPGP